jgi:hypothetical protein
MDSRDILPDAESLYYVLDTQALEANSHPELSRLLHYQHHDSIHFLRTPDPPDNPNLATVPTYHVNYDLNNENRHITWGDDQSAVTRYSPEKKVGQVTMN